MIIKSTRILASSSPRRFCDHVFRGEENDSVMQVQGTEQDIADAFRDAQARGDKYALRHWIIAPGAAVTQDQFRDVLQRLAEEFEFDARSAVIQHHIKPRATVNAFAEHWHMQVPERDASTGKGLSTSFDHARHEFIARMVEIDLGHPIIPGSHTRAVLARMRAEGLTDHADTLNAATDGGKPPQSGFRTDTQRDAARKAIDLPEARRIIGNVWRETRTAEELAAALQRQGIALVRGDKEGEFIALVGGQFIGSLRRLARVSKAEIDSRMGDWNYDADSISSSADHAAARHDRQPDSDDGGRTESVDRATSKDGEAALDDDRGGDAKPRTGEPPPARSNRGPSQADAGTGHHAGHREGLKGLKVELVTLADGIADAFTIAEDEATSPRCRIEEAFNAERREIVEKHQNAARRAGSPALISSADLTAMVAQGEKRLAEVQLAYSQARNAVGLAEDSLAAIEARQQSIIGRVRGIIDRSDEAAAQVARDEIIRLRDAASAIVQDLTHCTSFLISVKADIARNAKTASIAFSANAASDAQLAHALSASSAHRQSFQRVAKFWPPIIYCGIAPARRIAAELDRQKLTFYDPDAKNIWGLPLRGPGNGESRT
jgi:hypothetical protein